MRSNILLAQLFPNKHQVGEMGIKLRQLFKNKGGKQKLEEVEN
jgi:hypothetical protein